MRALSLLLLCASGCVAEDLCGDWDETCVALRVNGDVQVDQLQVLLGGDITLAPQLTPDPAGNPHSLPVTTAVRLHDASGQTTLVVNGRLAGQVVGQAVQTMTLIPHRHQTIDVVLISFVLPQDMSVAPTDAGPADAATDAEMMPPPLHLFLLSERNGKLGDPAVPAGACAKEALGYGLGTNFLPLLGYSDAEDPQSRLAGNAVERTLVLPSGAAVGTLAVGGLISIFAPINELATGAPNTQLCVWTNFNLDGTLDSTNNRCGGTFPAWSQGGPSEDGNTGLIDPGGAVSLWHDSGHTACDKRCHVYCLEQ